MKKIGIIAILAGLFLVVIYPWLQIKLTGEEVEFGTVYQRSQKQFRPLSVDLDPSDNPVRIRLYGHFLPGGAYLDDDIPLFVAVLGDNGSVIETEVRLSTSSANQHAPERDRELQAREDGTVLLANSTEAFNVPSAGTYSIELASRQMLDFSLSKLDVSVLARVTEPTNGFRFPGIALIVAGGILIYRDRRRRKKERRRRRRARRKERHEHKRRPKRDDDEDDDDDQDDDDWRDDDDDHKDRARGKRDKSKLDNPWDNEPPSIEEKPPEPVAPTKPKKPRFKWGRQGTKEE